jgi:DNA-binding response OmpR family regulator
MSAPQQIIAVIDDNEKLRDELMHQLSQCSGLQCHASSNYEDIVLLNPNLIIINIDNSQEKIEHLINEGYSIIALKNKKVILNSNDDCIDILEKPIRLVQLLSYIRFLLERQLSNDVQPFMIGHFQCIPIKKELINSNGIHIKLTEKETDVLCYLYSAKGEVVSREDLLSEVWGYNQNVTTHTLETHMYRLRKKIENKQSHTDYLITEAGGYKLNFCEI